MPSAADTLGRIPLPKDSVMDVILDANIYASDFRTEKIAFSNLFDYLRKTNSRLVLPRIIREEVVALYGRELKKRARETAEAWNSYRHLVLPTKPPAFEKPAIEHSRRELRRRLMGLPSLTYYPTTAGV